jgi:hypothetical protein
VRRRSRCPACSYRTCEGRVEDLRQERRFLLAARGWVIGGFRVRLGKRVLVAATGRVRGEV